MADIEVVRTEAGLKGLAQRYQKKLVEDFGAEQLGSGFFSKVFTNPNDPSTVIKVGFNSPAFMEKEFNDYKDFKGKGDFIDCDGYLSWIRKSLKYPSKHMPRIAQAKVFVNDYKAKKGLVYVVVSEKLEVNPLSRWEQGCYGKAKQMAKEIYATMEDIPTLQKLHRKVARSDNAHAAMLGQALTETWQYARKDLHNGNWMVRKTVQGMTAVITDPAT